MWARFLITPRPLARARSRAAVHCNSCRRPTLAQSEPAATTPPSRESYEPSALTASRNCGFCFWQVLSRLHEFPTLTASISTAVGVAASTKDDVSALLINRASSVIAKHLRGQSSRRALADEVALRCARAVRQRIEKMVCVG